MQFKLFLESTEFMTLYRVDKSKVEPTQVNKYSRKDKPETKGIFLSREPIKVAIKHGIAPDEEQGLHLYTYKVARSIKREPGVSYGIYDGAWEMFIPSDIWIKYSENGLIKFLGRSHKKVKYYHQYRIKREEKVNSELYKTVVTKEINRIKQFVLKNKLGNLSFTDILERYFSNRKLIWDIDALDYAKDLFTKHHIPFKTPQWLKLFRH